MFELLATLCLGAVCGVHALPAPAPLTQAECEATARSRADGWASRHEGYAARDPRCVETSALAGRAAAVVEIAPGAYVHPGLVAAVTPENGGDVANTGFIIGDDAVAVIDSGSSRALGEALYLAVRQRTDLPIRWLILTHMHPDHTLGAEVFREAGAEIIGAATLPMALASRNPTYMASMWRLLGVESFLGSAAILPDRTVEGREEIDLGGRALELQTYPTAHTNNDLTVLDRAAEVMWMGDLVFLEHAPALDGSITGWIAVLKALPPDAARRMVPGHGPASAPYPAGALPTLAYLEGLAAETRASIDRGESLGVALRHLGADLSGDWAHFDEFNPRNATNAYVELEWE